MSTPPDHSDPVYPENHHFRSRLESDAAAIHGGHPMIVIVMGVSGAGKSRVGERLAQRLKCDFIDGDIFHSAASKAKMASGTPLTDDDRWPWLHTIRAAIEEKQRAGNTAVFTCSSLKRAYRNILCNGDPDVCFVYLKGPFDLLRDRLGERSGHFFNPRLLQSQLDTLEEPGADEAVEVNIAPPVDQVVASALAKLAERFPDGLVDIASPPAVEAGSS